MPEGVPDIIMFSPKFAVGIHPKAFFSDMIPLGPDITVPVTPPATMHPLLRWLCSSGVLPG